MNKSILNDKKAQVLGYSYLMGPGEKTVFTAPGILDNIVSSHLVLTGKIILLFLF